MNTSIYHPAIECTCCTVDAGGGNDNLEGESIFRFALGIVVNVGRSYLAVFHCTEDFTFLVPSAWQEHCMLHSTRAFKPYSDCASG